MSKRILLIEDEADIREVYAELLQSEGYILSQAGDGDKGLALALSGAWDLMLLDIMLPKKDGLEILSQLKKTESLKAKPIILLTNLGKDEILDKCLQLGANGYLVKSNVEPSEVVDQVRKYFPDDFTKN